MTALEIERLLRELLQDNACSDKVLVYVRQEIRAELAHRRRQRWQKRDAARHPTQEVLQ